MFYLSTGRIGTMGGMHQRRFAASRAERNTLNQLEPFP
jgi:hypothetical protein